MSVSDNNVCEHSNDPEKIDLINLLMHLWRGRSTIAIAIVIAIIFAAGYLVVAKENGPQQPLLLNRMLVRSLNITMPSICCMVLTPLMLLIFRLT